MNLIDRITWRWRPEGEPEKVPLTGLAAIYDAPADFNRETRRRAGMLSSVWRWDIPASAVSPRYVRRHLKRAWEGGSTRRVRRERARCVRLMKARGIV